METCYKVFRREVLEGIELHSKRFTIEPELTAKVAKKKVRIFELHSKRFTIEPELTAKVAKQKVRIFEVPISYYGRTYAEGKKIGWRDGFAAVWAILRYNLFS
jgi:hypothetical protein